MRKTLSFSSPERRFSMTPNEQDKVIRMYEGAIETFASSPWIKGDLALTGIGGHAVVPYSSIAKCFCAEGAIQAAMFRFDYRNHDFGNALLFLGHYLELNDEVILIATWNDQLPHPSGSESGKEAVVNALKGAINHLKELSRGRRTSFCT